MQAFCEALDASHVTGVRVLGGIEVRGVVCFACRDCEARRRSPRDGRAPALGAFGLRHLGADSGVAPLLADQAGAGQAPLARDQETGSAHPVHTGQGVEPFQLEVPGHISKVSVGGRRRPSTRPLTRPMVGLGLRRGVRHMRIFRLGAVSAAFGLAVVGGTGWASLAAPAAQAATAPCMIVDQQIDASYTSVQVAENAAKAGDTLSATGTCNGTTEITKNLTITGGATLDGDQAGSVLTIDSGVTVTISSFTITGGTGSFPNFQVAAEGGGIYIYGGGYVTLPAAAASTATPPTSEAASTTTAAR